MTLIRRSESCSKTALIGIGLRIAGLGDLAYIVPRSQPFSGPDKFPRDLGIVELALALYADTFQRVLPVVPVYEDNGAVGRHNKAKKTPACIAGHRGD